MNALTGTLVLASGIAAGVINTIVGSGTLVTFPVLLATGYPAVLANMSNTVGLVAGNFSGAFGYRRELRGQRRRVLVFGAAALLGGSTGAVALLVLPETTFDAVVPVLVAVASVLVVAQPWLKKRLLRHPRDTTASGGPLLCAGIFVAGIYGGYFGAAAGVIVLALLALLLNDDLQRLNGIKNICIGVINAAAAIIFVVVADIAWWPVLLLAVGSLIGGQIGARVGRLMPPAVLRACVAAVGFTAAAVLLVRRYVS